MPEVDNVYATWKLKILRWNKLLREIRVHEPERKMNSLDNIGKEEMEIGADYGEERGL